MPMIMSRFKFRFGKRTDKHQNPYYTITTSIPGMLSLQHVVVYAFASIVDGVEYLDVVITPNTRVEEETRPFSIKSLVRKRNYNSGILDKISIRLNRRSDDGIAYYVGYSDLPIMVDLSDLVMHIFPVMKMGGTVADFVFRFYDFKPGSRAQLNRISNTESAIPAFSEGSEHNYVDDSDDDNSYEDDLDMEEFVEELPGEGTR